MKRVSHVLAAAVLTAALLWFWMFSRWTAGITPFWPTMAVSAAVLLFVASREVRWHRPSRKEALAAAVCGTVLAAVLWCVFWVGNELSSLLFGFARPQVEQIYGMKTGLPSWVIAVLLLLLIGPAEELFWRGCVQRGLSERFGADVGFVVAAAVYALVHIWSFNFMLVMAALVAGAYWGLLYRLRPSWLPALVVSHAVWDACVFVAFPL